MQVQFLGQEDPLEAGMATPQYYCLVIHERSPEVGYIVHGVAKVRK